MKKPGKKFSKPTPQTKHSILKKIKKNIKETKKTKKQIKRTTFVSTLKPNQERLERHLAHTGLASRREAKTAITKGWVTVNGKVIREPGFGIDITKDKVKITGGLGQSKETILLYKPRGIETVKTSPDSADIHTKFPQFAHLAPVGRLDKDSEGLILLSNDGVLARAITGEKSTIEKEYQVKVREDVIPALLKRMESGIRLDGEITLPCLTHKISRNEYTITLTEGRKHQVRRMANACKLTVTRLVRIRIGDLKIGKMTAGNFKRLPESIIQEMKKGA